MPTVNVIRSVTRIGHAPSAVAIALAAIATATSRLPAQERPDTARLTPVVVTATRIEGTRAAPTATATVLEGAVLRERGIRLVADALREVPGMSVVRGGSPGAVTSVFLRGGESDYVKVLVDGIAINEPGGAVDLANLTTENVDRIEIVRGPTSVLYGSEAVAGVVQVFTIRGSGAPQASAGAKRGTWATREFDMAVQGAGPAANYALSGAHAATDGILPFNNRHRSTSLGGSVGTGAGTGGSIRLTARFTDGRYHFPTTSGGEAVDSNQFSFERRVTAGLEAERRLASRVVAHIALTSSGVDAGAKDDPDNAADTAGAYAYRSGRRSTRQGADTRLDFELAPSVTATAGLDLDREREHTSFSSEHGTFGPFRAPDRNDRRWNRGYYGQLLGDVGPTASYTLGARVDDNETFGTFFTYRAGAGLRISPLTTLRAAIGTAFKSPIFHEITGAGFAQPNPGIEPERSRSWDVGVEHAVVLGRRELRVGATWFDQRFRDMIQFVPVAGDPFAPGQYRNVAGARAWGAELEARAVATDRLTILANTTLLRTRALESVEGGELAFRRGEPLIRRPRVAGSAVAHYRVFGSGSIGLSLTHTGRRDDVDFTSFTRVELPSHTLAGASLVLPLGSMGPLHSVALRASGENLLDADYSAIAGFPAPGRTVLIGASAVIGGR